MNAKRILDGRYEVGELIGRGGMADVHLGRDIRLGRAVAIKLLRTDLARDPVLQSRFRREAQAVAALNHHAIVSIFDTGEEEIDESAEGARVPFIVMEHVKGRTLRDLIRAGEISIDKAIDYARGVLSALDYSHRAGIVHRDIKPANVMVTPDGGVKVMDFGIARAMADSAATMTQTQTVIGTAQYLSPEQARGETVDARSDLYSAACLLYEMLAGRPPFVGDSPVSVAYQHVREQAEPPSAYNDQVPPALDSVVSHGLQKDRKDRFQDAAAFIAALDDARAGIAMAPVHPTAPLDVDAAPTTALPGAVLLEGHTDNTGQYVSAASLLGPEDTDSAFASDVGGPLRSDGRRRSEEPLRSREDRDRRRAWIVTLFLALALVLGVGAYVLYSMANAPEEKPPTVAVPAVSRLSESEALNKITAANLRPIITKVHHDTVPSGDAINTDPAAGEQVALDSNVTVRISTGPSQVTIPENLAGKTEAQVRDLLRSLGLVGNETIPANSATVRRDMLISTEPALGRTVPVGTKVNLVVSNGQVTVPNLIELTRAAAEAALEDPAVRLPYTVRTEENAVVKPGTVTAQSVPANTSVDQGTRITFTVAVEPKPTPTPTTDPVPDPESGGKGRGKSKNSGGDTVGFVEGVRL